MLYSGAYFDCGGPESQLDWERRGMYFYFSWPRDGDDKSTRVNLNYQLAADIGNDGRVLLFDHHKKIVIITLQDGRVIDLVEQNA